MTIRRCSGGWRALPLARILNPAGNRDRSPAYALFLPTRTMNNEPTLSAARLPQKFPGTERVDGHEIEPSRPTWRAGARAHRALARGPRPYAHMQTAGIRCYVFEHPAGHLRQAGSQASPVLPNSAPVNEHPSNINNLRHITRCLPSRRCDLPLADEALAPRRLVDRLTALRRGDLTRL